MKHIKKYNEDLVDWSPKEPPLNEPISLLGEHANRKPIGNSVIKMALTDENIFLFQTCEGGVIIKDPAGIDKLIEYLMEYKDKML